MISISSGAIPDPLRYPPHLFVDGIIAQTFTPADAERYMVSLFKLDPVQEPPSSWPNALSGVGEHQDAFYLSDLPRPRHDPTITVNGRHLWLVDYVVHPERGTIVPQRLWSPQSALDRERHVANAHLQMPIFFIRKDGEVGVQAVDAAGGLCSQLKDGGKEAPLGGKSTTVIRLQWPGYLPWKEQKHTKSDGGQRQPITLGKLATLVGASINHFFKSAQDSHGELEDPSSKQPQWRVGGQGGITCRDVTIIGLIQVSAGGWMPLLRVGHHVDLQLSEL